MIFNVQGNNNNCIKKNSSTGVDSFLLQEHFLNSQANGNTSLVTYINGGGASISVLGSQVGAYGVRQLTTGGSPTGRSGIGFDNNVFLALNDYDTVFTARMRIPVLSAAGNDYGILLGFFNSFTTVAQLYGCYFIYDRQNLGNNWHVRNTNAGVGSFFNTGVAAETTSYNLFSIEIKEGSNNAVYRINNNVVNVVSGNLPSGIGFSMGANILKQTGGASRTFYLDYLALRRSLK